MILRPWKRIREMEEQMRELLARLRDKAMTDLDAARNAEFEARQALRIERESHAATRAQLAAADVRAKAAEERAEKLLAEILAMKRDGFHPPEPAPQYPPPMEDIDPAIRDALAEIARPGTELWYSELAVAQAELAHGKSPAEVAEAILRGGSYHPWRQ